MTARSLIINQLSVLKIKGLEITMTNDSFLLELWFSIGEVNTYTYYSCIGKIFVKTLFYIQNTRKECDGFSRTCLAGSEV